MASRSTIQVASASVSPGLGFSISPATSHLLGHSDRSVSPTKQLEESAAKRMKRLRKSISTAMDAPSRRGSRRGSHAAGADALAKKAKDRRERPSARFTDRERAELVECYHRSHEMIGSFWQLHGLLEREMNICVSPPFLLMMLGRVGVQYPGTGVSLTASNVAKKNAGAAGGKGGGGKRGDKKRRGSTFTEVMGDASSKRGSLSSLAGNEDTTSPPLPPVPQVLESSLRRVSDPSEAPDAGSLAGQPARMNAPPTKGELLESPSDARNYFIQEADFLDLVALIRFDNVSADAYLESETHLLELAYEELKPNDDGYVSERNLSAFFAGVFGLRQGDRRPSGYFHNHHNSYKGKSNIDLERLTTSLFQAGEDVDEDGVTEAKFDLFDNDESEDSGALNFTFTARQFELLAPDATAADSPSLDSATRPLTPHKSMRSARSSRRDRTQSRITMLGQSSVSQTFTDQASQQLVSSPGSGPSKAPQDTPSNGASARGLRSGRSSSRSKGAGPNRGKSFRAEGRIHQSISLQAPTVLLLISDSDEDEDEDGKRRKSSTEGGDASEDAGGEGEEEMLDPARDIRAAFADQWTPPASPSAGDGLRTPGGTEVNSESNSHSATVSNGSIMMRPPVGDEQGSGVHVLAGSQQRLELPQIDIPDNVSLSNTQREASANFDAMPAYKSKRRLPGIEDRPWRLPPATASKSMKMNFKRKNNRYTKGGIDLETFRSEVRALHLAPQSYTTTDLIQQTRVRMLPANPPPEPVFVDRSDYVAVPTKEENPQMAKWLASSPGGKAAPANNSTISSPGVASPASTVAAPKKGKKQTAGQATSMTPVPQRTKALPEMKKRASTPKV